MDRSLPTTTARHIWDVIEPLASSVYFAPEAHRAYEALGFDGPRGSYKGLEFPNMEAYFTSRGACLGERVPGHVVASAFGVFKRPMVVAAVEEGWKRTDRQSVLAAREQGAVAQLERVLGQEPEGLAWATEVLRRMADAAPGEGRTLFSGLQSLGYPGTPMGDFWRAADLVREHRGDSHIAAWVAADLDATEIGLISDPWRGQTLRSWVRSRGWSDDELDAACARLADRGLIKDDTLTDEGRQLRDDIESATDAMEVRVVAALGEDAGQLFALLDPWCDQIVAAHGYPSRVVWP